MDVGNHKQSEQEVRRMPRRGTGRGSNQDQAGNDQDREVVMPGIRRDEEGRQDAHANDVGERAGPIKGGSHHGDKEWDLQSLPDTAARGPTAALRPL